MNVNSAGVLFRSVAVMVLLIEYLQALPVFRFILQKTGNYDNFNVILFSQVHKRILIHPEWKLLFKRVKYYLTSKRRSNMFDYLTYKSRQFYKETERGGESSCEDCSYIYKNFLTPRHPCFVPPDANHNSSILWREKQYFYVSKLVCFPLAQSIYPGS